MTELTRRLAVALVVLGVVAAGTVAAVSVAEEDVPERAEVGETVTATITLNQLYESPRYAEWSVAGETRLQNVTWRVTFFDVAGNEIRRVEVDGQFLNQSAVENPAELRVNENSDTPAAEVRVQVTGDVPEIEDYTYPELGQSGEPESFTIVTLTQDRGAGGTSNTIQNPDGGEGWQTVHFTPESQSARDALDSARETIQQAQEEGLDVSEATNNFEQAREAYQEESFELAEELAGDAETIAQDELDGQGGGLPITIIAGAAVVLLVVAAAAVYVYRQRQGPDTKLR